MTTTNEGAKTEPKIVQIIPAERGWHTRHREGELGIWSEIACWALLESGDVVPVIQGDEGVWPMVGAAIYSPVQSWIYASSPGKPPDENDWELVVAYDSNMIWRRHG